jgi:iron complex transport system substrate-binding protein
MATSAASPVSPAAPSDASPVASATARRRARQRSRRGWTLRLAAGLAALTVLAGACGSGGGDETTAGEPSDDGDGGAPSENAAGDATFPVEIEHEYGTTTIEEKPERVVTVGLTDQDAVLALGVVPVGITDWFGDHPHAVWPWAQDLLGDAEPEVLSSEEGINAEAIAALQPDVILALYAGLTDDEYDTLSAIAPTVAQPGDYVDWGIPWQEQTRTIGRVLGQADEADALVQDVEDQLARARADHPEFEGATGVMATPYQERISVYAPEDVRGRFMADLGFVPFEGLEDLAGDQFAPELSLEQTELLDVDALVWILGHDVQADLARLHEEPLYGGLSVVAEGREVAVSNYDTLGGATSFQTVLSLPVLIEGLVPMLAAAVDGDPATVVEPPA